ncbi:pleckstrin homology domain-containing family S member 1 [Arapaima gigas]
MKMPLDDPCLSQGSSLTRTAKELPDASGLHLSKSNVTMPGKGQQRSAAVFYSTMAGVEEVRTGTLLKSPPSHCFKSLKSWKHRFFVLFKTSWDTHLLKYFRSEVEREKVLGSIDITKIFLIQTTPHQHSKWEWIQRTFKCPANCVLFIHTECRDYFLIAENRASVNGWYNDICKAMKRFSPEDTSPESMKRIHSLSKSLQNDGHTMRRQLYLVFSEAHAVLKRAGSLYPSQDALFSNQKPTFTSHVKEDDEETSHYITPRAILEALSQENDEEEDGAEEENSFYTKMENLEKKAKNEQQQQHMPIATVTKTLNIQKTEINDKKRCDEQKRSSGGWLNSGCLYSGANSSSLTDNTSDHQIDGASEKLKLQEDPFSSEEVALEEKEIILDQAELREHLKLEETDGRPCVTQWTAPSESICKFHQGDRVLAVNDLETSSVLEVEMYLHKLLKKKVKLTIQRLPGSKSFHADHCSCD